MPSMCAQLGKKLFILLHHARQFIAQGINLKLQAHHNSRFTEIDGELNLCCTVCVMVCETECVICVSVLD